jgi:hypothetical protein
VIDREKIINRSKSSVLLQDLSPKETVTVFSGTLEATDQPVKIVVIRIHLLRTMEHMMRHLAYLATFHPKLVNPLG